MLTHWERIKAAERMQTYIEEHLGKRITMASLARAAHYSQWHAARIFKDFEQAIESLWDVMKSCNPETYGYTWADDDGPRFQLCPEGYRGYIEGRPVRPI